MDGASPGGAAPIFVQDARLVHGERLRPHDRSVFATSLSVSKHLERIDCSRWASGDASRLQGCGNVIAILPASCKRRLLRIKCTRCTSAPSSPDESSQSPCSSPSVGQPRRSECRSHQGLQILEQLESGLGPIGLFDPAALHVARAVGRDTQREVKMAGAHNVASFASSCTSTWSTPLTICCALGSSRVFAFRMSASHF